MFFRNEKMIRELSKKHPGLVHGWSSFLGTPGETGKGGASHELSSNGIWSSGDPRDATPERGKKLVDGMVERAVEFIEAWKKAKI